MDVWTVANQKGGVGKTTTAVSLGALLAARGERCLLVDLDPHGSMTAYFGYDPDHLDDSVYDLFARAAGTGHVPVASLVRPTGVDGLELLPASGSLASVDRRFAARDGMGLALKRSLERLRTRYRFALVDCPPVFGILMLNALAACGKLLIPVQTDYLALKGLERLSHSLRMVSRGGLPAMEQVIVATMYDPRNRASPRGLEELASRYPDTLWDGVIPIDTSFRDASRAGVPLPIANPAARGAKAYRALLERLLSARAEPLALPCSVRAAGG